MGSQADSSRVGASKGQGKKVDPFAVVSRTSGPRPRLKISWERSQNEYARQECGRIYKVLHYEKLCVGGGYRELTSARQRDRNMNSSPKNPNFPGRGGARRQALHSKTRAKVRKGGSLQKRRKRLGSDGAVQGAFFNQVSLLEETVVREGTARLVTGIRSWGV